MEKIIYYFKKIRKYYRTIKNNEGVKEYYNKNKNDKIDYLKNIWSKNIYWDFFYQSLPHSIKSNAYVPFDYYGYKIESTFNDMKTSIYVNDKNMYDRIFYDKSIKLPKTIFRCINNIFMDGDYNVIEEMNKFISNIDHDIIIKKAIGSMGGKDVEKYLFKEGYLSKYKTNEKLNVFEVRKKLKGNFIVQELVKDHPELNKYHPNSLNTLRILSYRSVISNKTSVLMGALRIGLGDSFLDNTSAGGILIGLKIDKCNEAKLREYAVNDQGIFSQFHPDTNIKFKDNKIPNFPLVVKAIKKLANYVSDQRIIGWDFCINENGDPILIELNTGTGIHVLQTANGMPLFGEFTSEIKEYVKQKFI